MTKIQQRDKRHESGKRVKKKRHLQGPDTETEHERGVMRTIPITRIPKHSLPAFTLYLLPRLQRMPLHFFHFHLFHPPSPLFPKFFFQSARAISSRGCLSLPISSLLFPIPIFIFLIDCFRIFYEKKIRILRVSPTLEKRIFWVFTKIREQRSTPCE
jgi:hypothetical protein